MGESASGKQGRRDAAALFAVDPRSLAAFRIAAATLLLIDLAIRATALRAMYADEGMFPVDAARRVLDDPWRWSLHFLDGSAAWQAGLFALAAVAAVCLLVGCRTRAATVVSWLLLTSLHNRFTLVLNGGDDLLRLMLFWSMFLPLGQVWSLDARRWPTKDAHRPIVSVASAAILLQLFCMYAFTGLFKINDYWLTGSVLYSALAFEVLSLPLGRFLLDYPRLLQGITVATLFAELFLPWLLFYPRYTTRLRLAVMAAFWMLHVGIAFCLNIGLFSYIAMASWLVFLPRAFWESGPVWKLTRWIAAEPYRRRVARNTDAGQPLGSASVAHEMRRLLTTGLCLLTLLYVLSWNVAELGWPGTSWFMPPQMRWYGETLLVRQRWNMFHGPAPAHDGWYVAKGTLADGGEIDLFRDGASVTKAKPPRISAVFPNQRWRRFFWMLTYDHYAAYRQSAARYLRRNWNRRHGPDQHVKSLELIFFKEQPGRRDLQAKFKPETFARIAM